MLRRFGLLGFRLSCHTESEKAWAIPLGAGDGLSNHRQACIGHISPKEPIRHNGHGVPFAQVFTDEDRAGLEASVQLARLLAPSQSVSLSRPPNASSWIR
jgi:hypothetical protein